MIYPRSPYETCCALFADYPLAVNDCYMGFKSMILMQRKSGEAQLFMLSRDDENDRPTFILRPWRASGAMVIEANSVSSSAESVMTILKCSIPIPRHGSLFGWKKRNTVSALIAIFADYSPESPQPYWSVMPRVGSRERAWPPFAGESFLGHWFWEYYNNRRLVSLSDLIAGIPETVFWVETASILGWDSCAVARDVKSHAGYTLPQGAYVYWRALRTDSRLPRLGTLLANERKTDLAYKFQRCAGRDVADPLPRADYRFEEA